MGGSGIRRGSGRTNPAGEHWWHSARERHWRPTRRPRQQRAGFDSLVRTIGVTRRPRWQRDAPAHSVGVRATRLSSTLASPAAMASAPWPNSPNAPSTVWRASRGLPEGTMGGPTGLSLPLSTDSVWGGRASVRTEDGATSHRVPRWSSDAHPPVPRLPWLSPNERGVLVRAVFMVALAVCALPDSCVERLRLDHASTGGVRLPARDRASDASGDRR